MFTPESRIPMPDTVHNLVRPTLILLKPARVVEEEQNDLSQSRGYHETRAFVMHSRAPSCSNHVSRQEHCLSCGQGIA